MSERKLSIIIRARRIALGQTQQQAAEAIGVTPETVSRWESGRLPEDRSCGGLAKWLDRDIEEVLALIDKSPP